MYSSMISSPLGDALFENFYSPRSHITRRLDDERETEYPARLLRVGERPDGKKIGTWYVVGFEAHPHLELIGGGLRILVFYSGKAKGACDRGDRHRCVGANREHGADRGALVLHPGHANRSINVPGAHYQRHIGILHAKGVGIVIGHDNLVSHLLRGLNGGHLQETAAYDHYGFLHDLLPWTFKGVRQERNRKIALCLAP